MGVRKVFVEVGNAANLMPKDGEGSASPYCVIDFDGQRQQTDVQAKSLNPVWNSVSDFTISNPASLDSQTLSVTILSVKRPPLRRPNFLGRVRVRGSSFSKAGEETLVYYKLKRRSLFSQVKGEIGLKIWWMDEPDPPPPEEVPPPPEPASDPPAEPAAEPAAAAEAAAPEAAPPAEAEAEGGKGDEEGKVEDERIEVIEKKMMLQLEPVFWDHDLPYACEVPWNNFISASLLDNPYINLPVEEDPS